MLETVSVAALVELPVEAVLVNFVGFVVMTWLTVPVRVTSSASWVERLLGISTLVTTAWPVKVETATALPVLVTLTVDCLPGNARLRWLRKLQGC